MLPLELLTDEVKLIFEKNSVKMDDIELAIKLDLNFNGDYGESWLVIDLRRKKLCRLSLFPDYYDEFELADIKNPYIDNFTSSSRLLAQCCQDGGEHEADTSFTVILAYCTNLYKRKLFAFLDIFSRILKDEKVSDDDPIFEQFNNKCPKCGELYSDQTRKICLSCINRKAIFLRLLKYFKPFMPQLIIVLFCMVATSAISLLNPIINGLVLYDNVIASTGKWHTIEKLYIVIGVIIGMAILSLLINIIQNRANARMSTQVVRNMKLDIFNALSRLSLSYFNNNETGRLINRVNYDPSHIQSFYIDGIPNLVINGLNFIGLTIFLFTLNPVLTLLVFVPVPIIVFIFKFMLPKLWRMYTKQWRASSSMNAMLGDSLNGARVVKAFAKEADETYRFTKYASRLYSANLQVNLTTLTIFPLVGLLIGMSSQAIWGFGGINVMGGHMTYGEFTTYLLYLGMIFGPLNFFTNFTNMLTDTINAAQRMFQIIDTVPEITDAPDAVSLDPVRGEIQFNKVFFHYNPSRSILKDVSFKIEAGQHIGLVGRTGSGKSTIANLITRMYDVISGSIMIDGVNIKNIKIDCLRKNVAIVSQEVFLFRGTIADNIRYARPDATMEEVIDAARAANAHDFISRLPNGYETIVGAGSRSLSGGEQQRISIARALLLKPPILILDEATAAMDTETEQLINEAISKLIQGRTTITIAHRLSTLKDCSRLYVIENGEIVEEGTHDELYEKGGVYHRLYTIQSDAINKIMSDE